MKRVAILIVSVAIYWILLIILITGCTRISVDKELAACGSFAVPGMFCSDLKGGSFSCKVLERDTQGRILFSYETTSCITNNWEQTYVICQRSDPSAVYFYEDICYILAADTADLEVLKTANDWNKPLNEEKLAKREYGVSADLFLVTSDKLELPKIIDACCEAFHVQEEQIGSISLLDVNENNQTLYWLTVTESDKQKTYCIMVDTDYKLEYAAIEDSAYWEQIQAFKQANWTKSSSLP